KAPPQKSLSVKLLRVSDIRSKERLETKASASGSVIAPASQESETFFRNLKLGAQSFGNQLIIAP
ncbi:MAG: hypothetical protein II527_09020, partial [Bacteroidales bacterium]|nr:hypothetical protein [Bacteroidales bacterium]